MSDEEKHEWDRLTGESSKAYAHICLYRDMGTGRSLRQMKGVVECTSHLRQLMRWSARWKWVERCRQYDDHLELQDRLQAEKDRREMHKRHARMGMLAQNFAVRKLEKMINKIETDKDQDPASPAQVAHILDIGVKVERLARGEATESQELSGPGGGAMKLSLQETLRQIAESYGFQYYGSAGDTRQANDATGTLDPQT